MQEQVGGGEEQDQRPPNQCRCQNRAEGMCQAQEKAVADQLSHITAESAVEQRYLGVEQHHKHHGHDADPESGDINSHSFSPLIFACTESCGLLFL